MSLIEKIRIAQRDAGELDVIKNLARMGFASNPGESQYATADETAAVMRPSTPNELWLHEQLDRIDPHRHEQGSAGDTPALMKLVFELKAERDYLLKESEARLGALRSTAEDRDHFKNLLREVTFCFTRDDDLPDELLPRIDAALKETA